MAKVEFVGEGEHFVPVLNRNVQPGDVVEIPDEAYEAFVPAPEHRSEHHPWLGVEAPAVKKAAKKSAPKEEV